MPTLAPTHIGVEILDSPTADPALVRRMLGDIARANRWFGGVRAMKAGLRVLQPATTPQRLTMLDVGTGAGDLPLAAREWGRAHGVDIGGVGVERHRAAARLSHDNGVPCVVACGSALPFRSAGTRDTEHGTSKDGISARSASRVPRPDVSTRVPRHFVDVVLISQLLHHFDDAAAVALIAEAASVARRGVILADLRPTFGAATAFRLAGRVMGFHHSTVTDGVVSVARGRSATALAALASRAGARSPIARNLSIARVMVAFRTDH